MKIYNAKEIFSNLSDRQSDLEAGLKAIDHYWGTGPAEKLTVGLQSRSRRT
jgi:hypothetical protein